MRAKADDGNANESAVPVNEKSTSQEITERLRKRLTGEEDAGKKVAPKAKEEKPAAEPKAKAEEKPSPKEEKNFHRIVTKDRYAELKKRLNAKFNSQLNMGIDPEIAAILAEMTVYHLEGGIRKFADVARTLIADCGNAVVPYLKKAYKEARSLFSEYEDHRAISEEMDDDAAVDAVKLDGEEDYESGKAQEQKAQERRAAVDVNAEKARYAPSSRGNEIGSVIPVNMAKAVEDNLAKIGDVDAFVAQELGYLSKDELYKAMSAEQIDGTALALTKLKAGKGFIIGDMTGTGKGRQAAATIRWACAHGQRPVFVTEKKDLFSDLYRDLSDIGSGNLRPFIFDTSPQAAITDANGKKVHKQPSAAEMKSVLESGQIPEGYDFMVITYSQLSGGEKNTKNAAINKAKRDVFRNAVNGSVLIICKERSFESNSQHR